MMMLTRKTLLLLGALVALLGLNFIDSGNSYSLDDALPTLTALPADELTRIEVSSASAKTILMQEDGAWQVTAPYEARADQALLQSLIASFRKEVSADVRVDTGNLEEYGLDTSNGIVAEFWLGGEEPAASFTVGYDAPGGASFVRLSGDDAVYRMRVGGRHRYEMPPIAWRNRVLLDFDAATVQSFLIEQRDQDPIRFVRGASPGVDESGMPIPGEWGLQPAVPWQVDQYRVEAMVRAMGMLRAGGLLGSEGADAFRAPRAILTVTLDDGTVRKMTVSNARRDTAGFVQVGEEYFQVSASRLDLALKPKEAFQNLTIFAFAREDIDTLALSQGSARIILQQTEAEQWTVLQPENIDIDLKQVYFAVNTLRELRAVSLSEITLEQAGLVNPAAEITVRLLSGQEVTLQIGGSVQTADGSTFVFVRRSDSAQVYTILPETIEKLRRGFGRG